MECLLGEALAAINIIRKMWKPGMKLERKEFETVFLITNVRNRAKNLAHSNSYTECGHMCDRNSLRWFSLDTAAFRTELVLVCVRHSMVAASHKCINNRI